jgi:hypothetical protein
MGYNALQPLTEGSALDLEFFNSLAENDAYLKNIIPDVIVNTYVSGIAANSEIGSQMKIQGASVPLASYTGTTTVAIPFPIAHIGTYPAIVVVSITGAVPTSIMVAATTAKNFSVKLVPSATGQIRGQRLNWIALTQVAG